MKNIEIIVTPSSAGSVDILLEGELVLTYLQEVIEQLKSTVSQYAAVRIKLQNIINIDLTCIQLLFAIKHSASATNKAFACEIELPEEGKNVLVNAGLSDLANQLNTTVK